MDKIPKTLIEMGIWLKKTIKNNIPRFQRYTIYSEDLAMNYKVAPIISIFQDDYTIIKSII